VALLLNCSALEESSVLTIFETIKFLFAYASRYLVSTSGYNADSFLWIPVESCGFRFPDSVQMGTRLCGGARISKLTPTTAASPAKTLSLNRRASSLVISGPFHEPVPELMNLRLK
jgi:hypothetical protein